MVPINRMSKVALMTFLLFAVAPTTLLAAETQPPLLSEAQREEIAENLLAALTAADLENITIGIDARQQWVIGFENRSHRSDIDAIAVALRAMADTMPPVAVLLRVKRDDVAVCNIILHMADYAELQEKAMPPKELSERSEPVRVKELSERSEPVRAKELSEGWKPVRPKEPSEGWKPVPLKPLAERWQVRPGAGRIEEPLQMLAQGNSSHRRVDIAARPGVEYEIGAEPDPFESDYFLITRADTTLAPNWHANLRLSSRLTSGQSNLLDRALVTHTRWAGDEWLVTGSVGKFRDKTYGWYGEVQWDNNAYRLGVLGGITGDDLGFSGGRQHGLVYYEGDWGRLGLIGRLGYGRFLETGEKGAVLSLRRQFGESAITAEAVRAGGGEEGVNFRFSVPLGPRRAKSPSSVRLRSDTAFQAEYEANFAAVADYLQGSHDLSAFRGELSAPYIQENTYRVLGQPRVVQRPSWPVAPSFEGTSGLMRIPTSDVVPDGHVRAGISYMDKEHSKAVTQTDAMPMFGAIGFLPKLEIVGRITVFHDAKAYDWPYNLDRSFHIHYRLHQQDEYTRSIPSIAIGIQDVDFGSEYSYIGKAAYVVGTWQHERWRLHIGAGQDRLDGVFGGMDFDLSGDHKLHLMAEYDSDYVNAGARAFLGDWGSIDIAVLGMSELCGSVVFHTHLK